MRRGLAASRHQAAEMVARGAVRVAGTIADKPARLVGESEPVVVSDAGPRFVSRGGYKLDAALERFAVPVHGRRCLDAGAATGGFTDCLLQRGALHVTAVDVAYGKIDPRLRSDPRVTLLERTNIRDLDVPTACGPPFDVVVADLSFISLTVVVPRIADELAVVGADLVLLVKPQFEAGRKIVSRGRGVVKDPDVRRAAVDRVARALRTNGAALVGAMASPILGPSGNAEFLVHARAHALFGQEAGEGSGGLGPELEEMLDQAIESAPDAERSAGACDDREGPHR